MNHDNVYAISDRSDIPIKKKNHDFKHIYKPTTTGRIEVNGNQNDYVVSKVFFKANSIEIEQKRLNCIAIQMLYIIHDLHKNILSIILSITRNTRFFFSLNHLNHNIKRDLI